MSAAKRRIKRKIAQAILRDRTERRMRLSDKPDANQILERFFHQALIPSYEWFGKRGLLPRMMTAIMRARAAHRRAP